MLTCELMWHVLCSYTGLELVQLKSDLETCKRMLSNETVAQEAQHIMKVSISQYVEIALKAGETAESLKQQMTHLCYREFLIPRVLYNSVLELVEKSSSAPTVSEVPVADARKTTLESIKALFCKEVLYHACLCCLAVHISDPLKLTDFLGPNKQIIYHYLDQASMSISTAGQDTPPYMIAVEKSTIYVAFRGEMSVLDWSRKYASLEEGKFMLFFCQSQ